MTSSLEINGGSGTWRLGSGEGNRKRGLLRIAWGGVVARGSCAAVWARPEVLPKDCMLRFGLGWGSGVGCWLVVLDFASGDMHDHLGPLGEAAGSYLGGQAGLTSPGRMSSEASSGEDSPRTVEMCVLSAAFAFFFAASTALSAASMATLKYSNFGGPSPGS